MCSCCLRGEGFCKVTGMRRAGEDGCVGSEEEVVAERWGCVFFSE